MKMTIPEKMFWIFVAYIMTVPWIISGIYFETHWDARTMLYIILPSLLTVLGMICIGLGISFYEDEKEREFHFTEMKRRLGGRTNE